MNVDTNVPNARLPPSPFCALPDDVLLAVMAHLPVPDLLRLRQVRLKPTARGHYTDPLLLDLQPTPFNDAAKRRLA